MLKGQHLLAAVEENMSNLTSASNEASGSSVHQYFNAPQNNNISSNDVDEPPPKRKRNLPGNPDPDAEVIALSPKTLMATNRFVCEVCGKGFQRDQNLQLHRRGHNLPWKLKQRSTKEPIRKKVYVCPEKMCVHHDPSRALGDLTGIKKHFCRKHGEKKYKCEKCSKKYAVQSDWKAHSKTCGTREYRCDCGTLFSRRDSFITHRAFCDALAEESGRGSNNVNQENIHINPQLFSMKKEQNHGFNNPPWLAPNSSSEIQPNLDINHGFDHHQEYPSGGAHFLHEQNPNLPSIFTHPASSSMISATALLQKASQMGATSSRAHQGHHVTDGSSGFGLNLSSRDQELVNGFLGADKPAASSDSAATPQPPPSFLQEMMTSSTMSAAGFSGPTFVDANFMINSPSGFYGMSKKDASFGHIPSGIFGIQKKDAIFDLKPSAGIFGNQKKDSSFGPSAVAGSDAAGVMTRDFLGLRPLLSQSEIFSIANLGNMEASEHHQESWQQG